MNDGQWRAMETWSIKGMPVWGTSVGITIDIWGAHWTRVSRIAVRFFTIWATRKAGRICQYLSEEPPSWTFWILCVCGYSRSYENHLKHVDFSCFFQHPVIHWIETVRSVLSFPPPTLHHGLQCEDSSVLPLCYSGINLSLVLCIIWFSSQGLCYLCYSGVYLQNES